MTAKPGLAARRFAEWTATLPADVETTFKLTGDDKIDVQGRQLLAGALSYVLTQLDLIPDHEKAGAVDDAFVLRVAYGLAANFASKAGSEATSKFARMTQDEEQLQEFLGDKTFGKLREYVARLHEKPVRGRTVEQVLAEGRTRQDWKRELDQQMKKVRPLLIDNEELAAEIEVSIQSYLKMKLK
jgi:uncharacterized membrane protein YkvA (DUF1232 family)